MYLLGYSLDNLSLMALTLSVGFVVDDAIVMLENIVRHMEMGKTPMQAAFDGSKEIAFTIVSMTLSLTAVFIPVLFMGGIVGRLLHEFAVTIGVAILVSGFVSISLTPMLCSRFLKPPHTQTHGRFYNAIERMFDGVAARCTTGRCGSALRTAPSTMARLAGAARRHRLSVHARSRKASCRARTAAASASTPRRSRASAIDEMVRHQLEVGDDRREGSERRRLQQQRRLRPRRRQRQPGAHPRRPEAARRARADGRPDHRGAAAEAAAGARHPRLPDQPAADQHRRPAERAACISSRCRTPTPPSSITPRRCSRTKMRQTAGPRGRQQRPADQEPAGQRRPGSRQDLRARPDGQPGGDGAVQRVRHAAGVADLRAEQPVPGDHAGRAGVPERSGGAVDALRAVVGSGQLIPLEHGGQGRRPTSGRSSVNHTGQLPSVTISFNLKPGVALGDAVDAGPGGGRGRRCPRPSPRRFQGAAQAFQDSLQGLGLILRDGDRRDLHRARHPVRELHASADDSLRAAVGRLRRAAHAAASSRPTSASTRSSASSCSSAS